MSARLITLFTAPPPSRSEPSSFAVSILLHGTALGIAYLGLTHRTRIDDLPLKAQYTVRLLELHSTEPHARPAGGIAYPGPQSAAQAAQSGARAASVPLQLAQLVQARQTIVQPDLPPDVVLPRDTPIPSALLWSSANSRIKRVVPPPLHEANTANVPPSLDPPNHEVNLADLKMSATPFATVRPAPAPSTSSPLVVHGPEPVRRVPEMASSAESTPTPARVMSISDLQMREGTIVLPPANQTGPASPTGALVTGHSESGAQTGSGDSASKQAGPGAALNTGSKGEKGSGSQVDNGSSANGSGGVTGTNAGSGQTATASPGTGDGDGSSVNRIALPKNGRFGVVVVGSSLADEYPETTGLWGSRLAYTVYVHAGLAKNWILQYSLPRATEAAAAGDTVRPDAPWPFYIVVPHVAPGDLNADAIMVHGFVDITGRFEQLAVVSPPDFPHNKFVLSALQEWKFRPATQNGQVTAVEVLLIIPEEPD